MEAYKNRLPEKIAANRVILSQIARLQHNRVNTPVLQKNIGKIMIFSAFKENWLYSNSLDLGGCGEDVAHPYALIECLFQLPVTVERENW